MRNPELFIYRLGLVLCVLGTPFFIASIIAFVYENYFVSLLFGFPALVLVGFGVDFIVKRSPEDFARLVAMVLSASNGTFYDKPFTNPDDKHKK